ncbi:MAG: hypothetical protein JSV29_04725 [Candidatus Bathyarchaeota archaeon]|nr:MAG: hypothetical protein JSV29_04725 [Candidatus Bathyarchaeota archaeon]
MKKACKEQAKGHTDRWDERRGKKRMEETSEADGGDGWPEGRTQMYSAPAHSEECRGLRGGLSRWGGVQSRTEGGR